MTFVSAKVKSLPPYLFSEFQKKKSQLEEKGIDVIDLGIGAPDLPTPKFIIDELVDAAYLPSNHRYSTYSGCDEFREAVAMFYEKQYGVHLDPSTEVLTLIGSKEGIANLVQAVINPGDTVFVPDPGYPVYRSAVHLAGGVTVDLPLDIHNGYVPLFSSLAQKDLDKAKLLFLNYPSNPTAATINFATFLEAISFAEKNNLLIAHDMAYDLVTFDGYKSPSILQAKQAKHHAVEFGSLSKSFNMTGWRIGYIVGNKDVIKALSTLKSNLDTSQFLPIQKAAATALKSDLSSVAENNSVFKERMEIMYEGLKKIGIYAERPKGTIFLWAKIPDGFTSITFANKVLEEAGVIVTPGTAFGQSGEGFIRIALTVTADRLREVVNRLENINFKGVTKQ